MSYKTWVVRVPDGPFDVSEQPDEPLGPNQVLVKIEASGLNPLDTKIRGAKAEHARQPLPAVLGMDTAGTVVATGAAVLGFQPGDEVFGMVGGVGGFQGTLAEFVAADVNLIAHKPKVLSMREAAALPLSTITAWEGLVDRARVGAEQTVLVHAGAGGVGYIAVQIALAYGARVFATVSPDKTDLVASLGATPINYKTTTVEEYVSSCTGDLGFDVVYDTVGGATLDASFAAVKRYTGHVVSCLGWGSHSLAPLSFRAATYSGVFTLLPLISGEHRAHHGKILKEAARLADAGRLRPLLHDKAYSTGELQEAFRAVSAGSLGKVVVNVGKGQS